MTNRKIKRTDSVDSFRRVKSGTYLLRYLSSCNLNEVWRDVSPITTTPCARSPSWLDHLFSSCLKLWHLLSRALQLAVMSIFFFLISYSYSFPAAELPYRFMFRLRVFKTSEYLFKYPLFCGDVGQVWISIKPAVDINSIRTQIILLYSTTIWPKI